MTELLAGRYRIDGLLGRIERARHDPARQLRLRHLLGAALFYAGAGRAGLVREHVGAEGLEQPGSGDGGQVRQDVAGEGELTGQRGAGGGPG